MLRPQRNVCAIAAALFVALTTWLAAPAKAVVIVQASVNGAAFETIASSPTDIFVSQAGLLPNGGGAFSATLDISSDYPVLQLVTLNNATVTDLVVRMTATDLDSPDLVERLLTGYSDTVPIGAADIEKPVEGPISVAREAHGLASKGPCGCSDPPGCMSIYAFGSFRVCLNGEFVREWRNAKSKMLFKYLVAHKRCSIAKECLMELFWPNNDPECARNNLNVAIYNIRQALKQNGDGRHVIVYRDGHYGLSPDFKVWTDFEAFDRVFDRARVHEREGDVDQQMAVLNELDELYVGDFLEEDRFEAWASALRRKYQDLYKTAIEKRASFFFDRHGYDRSIDMYKRINMIDACDEQVHRRLMTCFARLGQSHLAMRQFNACVEALASDLDLAPDDATVELFERIRRREPV